MGQRHQAFLIARVRPHGARPGDPGQRRCIAALHDQWCYGTLPLLAMRRLITLVSHPENAAVLRAELRTIDGQYGHGDEQPQIPNIPCPYAASLLASAWTMDLEAGRKIHVSGWTLDYHMLYASMGCWDGDNNDGISILDITEPDRPAYCFLQADDVLDAYGYLTTYYSIGEYRPSPLAGIVSDSSEDDGGVVEDDTEAEEDSDPPDVLLHRLRAIGGLEGVPVITADLLREAWPYVRFVETRPSLASSTATTEVATGDAPSAVPSLVDFTFDAAVKHSLDTGDMFDFERLISLPGKALEIKNTLRSFNPFRESGTQLLVRVLSELREDVRVDLANFQLSGTQLIDVLHGCGEIVFLDASFNTVLVADDIPKLLEAAPTLRRLAVIGCPSIVDAHILALVQNEPSRFKSLEGLLHPAFLTIEKPDSYPTAFTFANVLDNSELACASMPFFTPAQIIQALIDVLPWKDAKKNRTERGSSHPMTGFSAFHAGLRAPVEKFGQRPVVSVPFLTPMIPRGQNEFWAVVVSRASEFYLCKNQTSMWGFVHFTRSKDERTDAVLPAKKGAPTRRGDNVGGLGCTGQLYDLHGFLECMEKEGRAMPSEAAVKELERILYKKHHKTGEFYCPFMREEDVEGLVRFRSDRYQKGEGYTF